MKKTIDTLMKNHQKLTRAAFAYTPMLTILIAYVTKVYFYESPTVFLQQIMTMAKLVLICSAGLFVSLVLLKEKMDVTPVKAYTIDENFLVVLRVAHEKNILTGISKKLILPMALLILLLSLQIGSLVGLLAYFWISKNLGII